MTVGAERTDVEKTSGGLDVEERLRCAVCDHDLRDHDAISHRYCHATQAQALPRKCICQPVE
jgi:hypothetical protein